MSHEIRTPLSGIITLTTLLSDDDTLTPYQRDLVNTVRASGTLLLGIVRASIPRSALGLWLINVLLFSLSAR
jgi:signal transduction histidine kinase